MTEFLGIIQLIIWVVTAAGLYYKMRNDINLASAKAETDNQATRVLIKATNEKITKIEEDREFRWSKYNNEQKIQNEKLEKIAIGVAKIQNDVKWIKEKR